MDITSINIKLSEWANSTVNALGYIGIFIVSFVGSATVIFPLPTFIAVPAVAAIPGMNPWIIGLSAGIGAAFGEITGYAVGKGGGKLVDKKYSEYTKKYKRWFKKDNVFIWIIVFAVTPLPSDVLGIVCGAFNYDFKRFLLASVIGKTILSLVLAFSGYYGIPWLLRLFGVTI